MGPNITHRLAVFACVLIVTVYLVAFFNSIHSVSFQTWHQISYELTDIHHNKQGSKLENNDDLRLINKTPTEDEIHLINFKYLYPTSNKKSKTFEELMEKLTTGKYVYCADMFGRKLNIPWTRAQKIKEEEFANAYQRVLHNAVIEALKKRGNKTRSYFDVEGHSGIFKDQPRLYHEIAQNNFLRTVCETGFNAGHSSFIWLNSNPDLHVYSFDLGQHIYTRPMVKVLQDMFPNRLNITYGDSRVTLPEFHQKHPNIKCDLIVVDGGHTEDVPLKDLENFYHMVNWSSNHLLLYDDWPSVYDTALDMARAWKNITESGKVEAIRRCMNINSGKGLTIGRYTQQGSVSVK